MKDAQYAPVGPLTILEDLHSAGYLRNYILLIAHDILEHPLEYAYLTNDVVKAYRGEATIIVDNGVIEHGEALPLSSIIEAAQLVNASCVILPDVPRDINATLLQAEDCIQGLSKHDLKWMLVPQGRNEKELVACIDSLLSIQKASPRLEAIWGVPRWIASELGSRIPIVQYINARSRTGYWIHLLGMSTNISDDLRATKLPHVRGIDSANPIVLGLKGKQLGVDPYEHMPRGDYWERKAVAVHPDHVVHNIRYIRNAIG